MSRPFKFLCALVVSFLGVLPALMAIIFGTRLALKVGPVSLVAVAIYVGYVVHCERKRYRVERARRTALAS